MPEPELNLYQCDGLPSSLGSAGTHWSRQRNRIVRLRWRDGDAWEEDVRALCLDHYNELRKSIQPRHGEGS